MGCVWATGIVVACAGGCGPRVVDDLGDGDGAGTSAEDVGDAHGESGGDDDGGRDAGDDGGTGTRGPAPTDPTADPTPDPAGSSQGGEPGECGFSPTDPECDACLSERCCDEIAACIEEPGCACVLECVDGLDAGQSLPGCLADCQLPFIPEPLSELSVCQSTHCGVCL
ncbi:MAG: hypothetical protein AAF721_31070 [Myxococcota bacterium]